VGFSIELDDTVRRLAGDRILLGGSPARVLRLGPTGPAAIARLVSGVEAGERERALARRMIAGGLAHPRPLCSSRTLTVAIAIPVRDRPLDLDRCLAAIGGRTPALIIDDASVDGASIAAVARRHGARYLRSARWIGPAAARNLALSQIDSDVVAFLDSDCVPEPDWLEAMLAHLADPMVVAVAPRIRPLVGRSASAGSRATARERYTAARSPLDLGPFPGGVGPGRRIAYVPTAALAVRRTSVPGRCFDESLRYGEDVDFVWRLGREGTVRYAPEAVVRHREPSSWAGLLSRRGHYGGSAGPLAKRHSSALCPITVRPLPALAASLALAGCFRGAALTTLVAGALLSRRLSALEVPPTEGFRITARSVTGTAEAISRTAVSLAAPALIGAGALGGSRTRRRVLALLATAPLLEWSRRRPRLDPLRWTAAWLADEIAYGAGVWAGCLRERSVAPLLPRITWKT
jgi:mycofactocin system glycosyltransferase